MESDSLNIPGDNEEEMDTAAVAKRFGTEPRVLRQFLRSPYCSFEPVGSGSRYEFNIKDIARLKKEFDNWDNRDKRNIKPAAKKEVMIDMASDEQVWEEEGEVKIENINDPEIRAKVRWTAQEQITALHRLMREAGIIPGLKGNHQ